MKIDNIESDTRVEQKENLKQHGKVKKELIAPIIILTLAYNTLATVPVYAHDGSVIKSVYENYTYDDMRKAYDDVISQITNEQTIVNGPGYTRFQKNIAQSRLTRLENKKKVYNELLVIKGEGYTKDQKNYAERTLHDMETLPFQKAWEFGKKLGYKGIELFDYAISKLLCK